MGIMYAKFSFLFNHNLTLLLQGTRKKTRAPEQPGLGILRQMELIKLENILEASLNPTEPEHLRLKASLEKNAQEIGWEQVEAFMYNNLSKPVLKALESLPFYKDNEAWFLNQENGSCGLPAFMVAQNLIRISYKKGIPAAIRYFRKMTSLPYADGYITNLLLGIDIAESFDIYQDIKIVKIDDIPDSNSKDFYISDENKWHFNNPHSTMVHKPKCALLKKIRIEPLIFNLRNEPKNKNPLKNNQLFKEIALLLTLVGPSPALTSLYWFAFEDTDLQNLGHGGGSWYNHEILPPSFFDNLPIATKSIGKTVKSFFEITDEKIKRRILVSLERLNFSLRRRNYGDAALEISIALETIFAEDYGENTFKIGLRVALLIGCDFDQRKRIRSVIAALYKQRSQLVHRGEFKNKVKIKGFDSIESNELIKESAKYVAQSIKEIIRLKTIPDWNEYELGNK